MGILSYKLYLRVAKMNWPRFVLFLFFAIFILFSTLYDAVEWWPYWQKQWSFYLLLSLAMPLLFLYSAEEKWDRILGDVSLSVYLGHFLVIHFVKSYFILSPIALTLLSLLFIGLLSGLVYFIFQRPVEAARQRNYESGKSVLGL